MSLTDIPTVKAEREERRDSCLHCVVMDVIEDWFERHGERSDGKVVVDVILVIGKLSECMVEFTEATGDRASRRRAFRYAHDAIDAALKSSKTGKLVAVDIPKEQ